MEQGSGKSFHPSPSFRLASTNSPLGIPITSERGDFGAEGVFLTYPHHFPTMPPPHRVALASHSTHESQLHSWQHGSSQRPRPPWVLRASTCWWSESTFRAGRTSVSVCDRRWLQTIRLRCCVLCLTEGCPGLCNGNGRCTLDLNGWHCICQLGWRGVGCDTSMETACGDGKDNDGGRALAPGTPCSSAGVGWGPGWWVGVTEPTGQQHTSCPGREACRVGIKLHMWSKG